MILLTLVLGGTIFAMEDVRYIIEEYSCREPWELLD